MIVPLRRIALLAVTGVSLYLVAPALLDTFSSWQRLRDIWPGAVALIVALEFASLACVCLLQRLALQRPRWLPVVTSQLAGNAATKIVPGGGAVGSALQYGMLRKAGLPGASTASGLTAANLLSFGTLFVLPLLAVPAILLGPPVPEDLLQGLWVALGALAILFAVGAVLLIADGPLRRVGAAIQAVRNSLLRKRAPARRASGAPRPRARPDPRRPRAAPLGGAGRIDRPLAARLRRTPRGGSGGRVGFAGAARAARLRYRAGARADPRHAGRAGVRRGGSHGDARARGRRRGGRRPRDLRLPAGLVLVATARRSGRLGHPRLALPGRSCYASAFAFSASNSCLGDRAGVEQLLGLGDLGGRAAARRVAHVSSNSRFWAWACFMLRSRIPSCSTIR